MNLKPTYYSLSLLQNEFFQQECVEEILRERSAYEKKINKLKEFWILPSCLTDCDNKFYKEKLNQSFGLKILRQFKSNNSFPFFINIISSDLEFIKWLRLRLGSFISIGEYTFVSYNKFSIKKQNLNEELHTLTSGLFTSFSYDLNHEDKKINTKILKFYPNYLIKKFE